MAKEKDFFGRKVHIQYIGTMTSPSVVHRKDCALVQEDMEKGDWWPVGDSEGLKRTVKEQKFSKSNGLGTHYKFCKSCKPTKGLK